MKDLKAYGGWALVTGAAMGLGRAFAEYIASRGVDCVLVDCEEQAVVGLAEELTAAHGVECRAVVQDLTDDGFQDAIVGATAGVPVRILVNNAGIACGGDFATRDPGQLGRVVQVNCLAPVLLTRAFLPGMLEAGRGAVIFVGSLMSFVSAPQEAVYCGSKAFTLHLGEALWGELRRSGVDVLTVCPAGVRTGFYAKDGIEPEDVKWLLRYSARPGEVVERTFHELGKKPTTAACVAWWAGFLTRFGPRRAAVRVVEFLVGRLAHHR